MKKKISEITIPEGRRSTDWVKVSELAESIKIVGLINPITIDNDNTLIAGAHRYEACKYLGFDEIECIVLDCDELRTELAEIDENLIRNNLDDIAQGEFTIRRNEILEMLGLRAKSGTNVKNLGTGAPGAPVRTTQDIAQEIGVSKRTLRENIQLARDLTPEAKAVIREKELPKKEALALARKSAYVQNTFSKKLATGEVKNFADYKLQEAKSLYTEQSQESTKKNPPTLYIGDGIEWIATQQERCHLLLTDPPYSTDIDDIETFANRWLPIALNKVCDTGCAYVFIGAYPNELKAYLNVKIPEHMTLANVLVWHYKNTLGMTPKEKYNLDWQAILYYRGKDAPPINSPLTSEQRAVQEINAPDGRLGNRYHTWQKPDELAERFIRHATETDDRVYDPFACTGTFLLAASRLGRRGLGAEINVENAKIAIERGVRHE